VKPIDPTKPASFIDEKGNKKELHNSTWEKTKSTARKHENKTDNTQVAKSENSKETNQKGISVAKAKEALKSENTSDKSTFKIGFPWWIIWILLLLSAAWFCWRRYKRLWPF